MRDCEDSSAGKISLAFGTWLKAPVSVSSRPQGIPRRQFSDLQVPTDQGEVLGSPSFSGLGKSTFPLEVVPLISDNLNHSYSKEKETQTMHIVMDDSTEQFDIQEKLGKSVAGDLFNSECHSNKQIVPPVFSEELSFQIASAK